MMHSAILHPPAHLNVLFAVTFWPLLSAILLLLTPEARQKSSVTTFAASGALMTALVVAFMPGSDGLAAACSVGVSLMPLLLPAGAGRTERLLPFLVTGCALIALNVHSALAVTVLCGAGIVLLSWREAHGGRRAVLVWDMARTRLCGVVLASLGSALLPMQAQSPLGPVLLAVGLCMMAGLGPSPSAGAVVSLMETGLRFAAIVLMWRLNGQPVVHLLVLVAGFATLVFSVWGRGSVPVTLAALATIAAGVSEPGAIFLLLIATFGLTALEIRDTARERDARFLGSAPWPVFGALVMIGRALPLPLLGLLLLCVMLGLRGAPGAMLPVWPFARGRGVSAVLEVVLLICGVMSPVLLVWHPVAGWRP